MKMLTKVVSMYEKSVWTSSILVSFSITQLSTTSTPRAAFLQCLRWGIWCPFQDSADWKGEEIQLVLQGGAKPNPHGVMVYSTEQFAKTPSPVPLSAPGTAQVTHYHRRKSSWKEQNVKNALKGAKTKLAQLAQIVSPGTKNIHII